MSQGKVVFSLWEVYNFHARLYDQKHKESRCVFYKLLVLVIRTEVFKS